MTQAAVLKVVTSQVSSSGAPTASARSWAKIVQKGFEPDDTEDLDAPKSPPLVPAARGSLLTLCRGRLLAMCGHYGWITSLDKIDHPDAESMRHKGRIYLKSTDVREGCGPLKPGVEVVFALYADSDGLGAEDCRPAHVNEEGSSSAEDTAGDVAANAWSASKWSAQGAPKKRQHWQSQDYRPPPNSSAVVLVPPKEVFGFLAQQLHASHQTTDDEVFQRNMRLILDSESSSDDSSEDEESGFTQQTKKTWSSLANRCAKAIGGVDDARSWQARRDAVAAKQVGGHPSLCLTDPVVSVLDSMAPKASRASDGDSTSAGDASDSDGGATATTGSGLMIAPPPGLELPAASSGGFMFTPPPGLDAPLLSSRPTSITAAPAASTPSKQHPWRRR